MITYLELLQMIKDGKQPKKVKFGKSIYEWDKIYACDSNSYINDEAQFLSDNIIDDYFDLELTEVESIEVIEQ